MVLRWQCGRPRVLLAVAHCLGLLGLLQRRCTAMDHGEGVVLDVRMPGVTTSEMDEYWCINVELPEEPLNLVAIEPLSEQDVVHHMLLYGCRFPRNTEKVYRCGMQTGGTCSGPVSTPLYGWGKNAPGLTFPDGVAIQVGPGSVNRMMILEVHYLNPQPEGDSNSGVRLHLSRVGQPLSGGLISIATGFRIPPRLSSYNVHMGCCVNSLMPVHAVAMRVHTHTLGRDVKLARRVDNKLKHITSRDPQQPQGFYPMESAHLAMPRGTRLSGTCVFNSTTRSEVTFAGATSNDEMCNIYLMVHGELPYQSLCDVFDNEAPGHLPPPTRQLERTDWQLDHPDMGQVSAVAAVEDGLVWVFHRGSRVWDAKSYDSTDRRITYKQPIQEDCVLLVDYATGKVQRSWGGDEFYMPHGLTVDHESNLWLTDTGLHQVFKFSPYGKKLMELGTALQPGSSDKQFCKPTHVAVALAGDFYVADGYCNSRIMHYSAAGKVLGKIQPSKAEGQFRVPHSLLLDECRGLLIVADRMNGKVRSFDLSKHAEKPSMAVDVGRLSSDSPTDGEVSGLPYALSPGPYGTVMALLWQAPGRTHVVQFEFAKEPSFGHRAKVLPLLMRVESSWDITGPSKYEDAPHDLALIPDVPHTEWITERAIHVLVAETRQDGKGKLLRYRWRSEHPTRSGVMSGPTDEDGDPQIIVRDKIDLGEAIRELYMYGLPAAVVFAGVAVLLWRRLGDLEQGMDPAQAAA